MPQVKFDRIISCSSEDPAHPSKNLLLSREYNKKWKCKEPGEERASVIIQLTEPYIISSIDIGNESSTFVEVLVSRSSVPDDFQVLLVTSSFMTPREARSESNRNRVRMFSNDSLSDPVRKEKWDRIKVVCTQPFNKHLQHGLSFIVLHTTESKQEVLARPKSPFKALGKFALKVEDESDISVGSFFSRRKDFLASPPRPTPLTGAAAVRDASSPANLAEQKASKKRRGSIEFTDSQKKKRGGPKKDDTVSPSNVNAKTNTKKNGSPSQAENKPKRNILHQPDDESVRTNTNLDKILKDDDATTTKTDSDRSKTTDSKDCLSALDNNVGSTSSTASNSQGNMLNQKQSQSGASNVTYKPFNKLFEGIVIAMSGYENPGRGHIRDKALAMGSRYSTDWTSSSTHLICAFPNTPKYRQAIGQGIIVTREWIDDCYQERKKLSWKRYATDHHKRTDANIALDPEVWELIPRMDRKNDFPLPPASRRNDVATQDTRLKSESEDSEDEIERIKVKQLLKRKKLEEGTKADQKLSSSNNHRKKKTSHSSDSEDEIERIKGKQDLRRKKVDEDNTKNTRGNAVKPRGKSGGEQSPDNEIYNCSTDVDSEDEARSRLVDWSEEQKNARSKDLPPLPDFFKDTTFFLSRDHSEAETLSLSRYIIAFGGEILLSEDKSAHYIVSNKKYKLPEGSKSSFVTPEWIWECNDRQRLVPAILYEPD